METFNALMESFNGFVWGPHMMVLLLGAGAFLTALNTPPAIPDGIPTTILRSDRFDLYAQPNGRFLGLPEQETGVSYNAPELDGAPTVVLDGADHRETARALIAEIFPHAGGGVRLGLSGTPGVGKSTFIESFGAILTAKGLKVAVLAVDPSSARTGGSILGDKTRMERLARDPNAFIRPSPSRAALGGVARRTRETIILCEAAGYDVVMVETVGVGQSETMVADMTDLFLLLMAPAGGDELQGVKRGIMEIADMILVNKADGELKPQATRTCADYAGALRLMRKRAQDPDGFPKAMLVSAIENAGLDAVWDEITTLMSWRKDAGAWDATRAQQSAYWFQHEVQQQLMARITKDPNLVAQMQGLEAQVRSGDVTPAAAAAQIVTKQG